MKICYTKGSIKLYGLENTIRTINKQIKATLIISSEQFNSMKKKSCNQQANTLEEFSLKGLNPQ